MARLKAQEVTPQPAVDFGDVIQKAVSTKRKLKSPEKPRDFDPYAFDEMNNLGNKPKPTKNAKKKAPKTPQQKKVPGASCQPTPFSGVSRKRNPAIPPPSPAPTSVREEGKVNKFDNLLQFSSPEPESSP